MSFGLWEEDDAILWCLAAYFSKEPDKECLDIDRVPVQCMQLGISTTSQIVQIIANELLHSFMR